MQNNKLLSFKFKSYEPSLFIFIVLISFASVGTLLVTPSLIPVSSYFHISAGNAQKVISIFLFAYALSQLFYFPISNYYGRKVSIYIGIIIFLIGDLLCILSSYLVSFNLLITARFIMAWGAGACLTVGFTIIGDLYQGIKARQVTAKATAAFAIMPGIAIFIGGYLTTSFGWLSCYYFLFIYGVFLAVLMLYMPETLKSKNKTKISFKKIVLQYVNVLSNKSLLAFTLLYGLSTSILFIFSTNAPIIAEKYLHITPYLFGKYNLIIFSFYFLGNLLSAKLAKSYSAYKIMLVGIILMLFGSIIMLVNFHYSGGTLFFIFSSASLIFVGIPLLYSNAIALAISMHDDKASASAVLSFINMTLAVVSIQASTTIISISPIFMPAFFIFLNLIMAIILTLIKLNRLRFSNQSH